MTNKETCCGCIGMRKGVLALTGLQVLFGFLFMALSITFMSATKKAPLTKDFSAQDRDTLVSVTFVSAIVFGFLGVWGLVGFVSALKRWAMALKVFAILTLLSNIANLVYTIVRRNFGILTAVSFAISLYFAFVYYRYAAVVIPDEIEEEKNGKNGGYAV